MRFVTLLILFNLLVPASGEARRRRRGPRPEWWCLKALRRVGVAFKRKKRVRNVRTPVLITSGKIGNIIFNNGSKRAKPLMDCRTAWALYRTSRIFTANGGVSKLIVGKFYSYRYVKNRSTLSRHAYGLAFDIYGIKTKGGKTYMVASSYERHLDSGRSCEGQAKTRGGRLLRQLACDLDNSHYFKVILTPDSDRDHRDHFHISVYKKGEKRRRINRTTLLESYNYGRKWVKRRAKYGYPSRRRVSLVVKARYRANRRLIRKKTRRRRRKRRRRAKRR